MRNYITIPYRCQAWWPFVKRNTEALIEDLQTEAMTDTDGSLVYVSRLLAWCGNHLNRGGADLSPLVA